MNHITKISHLKEKMTGYWASRIFAQLEYSIKLSKVNNYKFDDIISDAVNFLEEGINSGGSVTEEITNAVEARIADLSPYAKKYTLLSVAHAHIDMNWMWDYSETVAITLGTLRTMLDLMEEYPDFTFSQSQASVYMIVEKHDPGMIDEIKKRIKEGRWEVSASTWVEADKNMPNGESHARHLLYTKRYLTDLLDLPPDTLILDFEPDTFGHNANVPEILAKGGVKYYYHCRGYDEHHIYRWVSPSGKSIIVFKDPMWYNLNIDFEAALYVPEFCEEHGMDCVMKVYGVGDHGGGPTRKDLEQLIDMASWPIFPKIRFSTYGEYFSQIEKVKDKLPVIEGELNFIFTGCYTTQSRIKMSNRIGEAKLTEAEALSSLSHIFLKGNYPGKNYEKAWKKILFNQFHDILPGSGTIETREYAMGEFQKVMAHANTGLSEAMRTISSNINTESLNLPFENNSLTRSEGGGVGFETDKFNPPHPERGTGINRIIHLFNPTQYSRKEPAEILIWDWEGNKDRIIVKNSEGKPILHHLLEFNEVDYWAHTYMRLLINAEVPAFGYATYIISESDSEDIQVKWSVWPRLEVPDEYVLENEYIKVEFNSINMQLVSLVDKETGNEMTDGDRFTGFRYIDEDAGKGMTAWVIGRYMSVNPLAENIRIIESHLNKGNIRQWFSYEQDFKESKLIVKISLDSGSKYLNYDVECDWHEKALVNKSIPQLNFCLPLSQRCSLYCSDIPFGTIDRPPLNHDTPANSWITAIPDIGDRSLMLISKTKYGFRGNENSLSLTLLRSSYDPDPYPDEGKHNFSFAIAVNSISSKNALIKTASEFNHPLIFSSGRIHKGSYPLKNGFICVKTAGAVVSSVKIAEGRGADLILRLYEPEGINTNVEIVFDSIPVKVCFTDLHEQPIDGDIIIDGYKVRFRIGAYSIESFLIEF